jgi:hypothetical protein
MRPRSAFLDFHDSRERYMAEQISSILSGKTTLIALNLPKLSHATMGSFKGSLYF